MSFPLNLSPLSPQYQLLADAIRSDSTPRIARPSDNLWFVPLGVDYSATLFRFAIIAGAGSDTNPERFEAALSLAKTEPLRRIYLSDANTALRTAVEMEHQADALRKLGFNIFQHNCNNAEACKFITNIFLGRGDYV